MAKIKPAISAGEGGSSVRANYEWILQTFYLQFSCLSILLEKGARLWNMNN